VVPLKGHVLFGGNNPRANKAARKNSERIAQQHLSARAKSWPGSAHLGFRRCHALNLSGSCDDQAVNRHAALLADLEDRVGTALAFRRSFSAFTRSSSAFSSSSVMSRSLLFSECLASRSIRPCRSNYVSPGPLSRDSLQGAVDEIARDG
jgi:hypothetical protein